MKPDAGGFTLIELLVTIAVAAILLTIGVPSFQELFNRNRVATVTNDFLTGINYARSEAVKNAQTTTICMSNDQATCTGNTGWANGWIIWVDRNNNGVIDNGEIVRIHGPINAGDTGIVGGTQTAFSFNSQGALTSLAGGDIIYVCPSSEPSLSRQLVVGASGLIVSQAPTTALLTCP